MIRVKMQRIALLVLLALVVSCQYEFDNSSLPFDPDEYDEHGEKLSPQEKERKKKE